MSDEHKAALAEGREQGRAVRRYLEALETSRPAGDASAHPRKWRSAWPRSDEATATADPLSRVHLTQERLDLHGHLDKGEQQIDIAALEEDFIAAAYSNGQRKGISYPAWREVGVEPRVLKAADISRSQRRVLPDGMR